MQSETSARCGPRGWRTHARARGGVERMVLQLFRFGAARRRRGGGKPNGCGCRAAQAPADRIPLCDALFAAHSGHPAPHGKIRAAAIRSSPTGAVSCTAWDRIPTDGMVSRNSMQSGDSASDLGGTRADPEPVPPCCNIPRPVATYYSMFHRTRLEDLRQTAPARWQHESARACTGKRRKPSGARDGRSQSQASVHDGLAWPVAL